jgi:arylsulfatase A-like enzyme
MNERDWEILKSLYDGETACLDHRMGLLFDYLEARGLLDDTLLIITSDHGDLLDRKGYLGHEPLALFDELIHTPLIVRYPGIVPGGKRIEHMVQICDWFPTFLELLHIEDAKVKREMQGVSLLPTWDDKPARDFIVAEHQPLLLEAHWFFDNNFDLRPWLGRLKTIRTLEWKYIWSSDGNDQLFDINQDPGESINLIASEQSRASDMRMQLENFLLGIERRDYGDRLHGNYTPFVERLKAWGFFRELRFPT